MEVGNRIRILLQEQNKRPIDLANFVGVDKSTVTKWTKGADPSLKYLTIISCFFKVSLYYLINGVDDRQPNNSVIDDETQELIQEWSKLNKRDKRRVEVYIYELQDQNRVKVNEQNRADA